MFDFPKAGPHPALIISHSERAENKELVNVLLCSSRRVERSPKVFEVFLDEADGLDWQTAVRCDLMYTVEKVQLYQRRGSVTAKRRRTIVDKIVASYAFNEV